jgi:hypothetical protein
MHREWHPAPNTKHRRPSRLQRVKVNAAAIEDVNLQDFVSEFGKKVNNVF